jgi:hypothetical protein
MITVRTNTDSLGITYCVVLHEGWTLLVLAVVRSESRDVLPWRTTHFEPHKSDAQKGFLIHAHEALDERGPG